MKRHFVLVALLCASLAAAQTPPDTRVTPNWTNADISAVAQSIQELTGTSFIIDQTAATRKISFTNRRAMTPKELYDTFVSILAINGLAVVPAGRNTMKIVQEANARTLPGVAFSSNLGPDELATAVIPVKNVNAQQIATVLNQLRSQYGVVQAVPGTNSIIVHDRASNVTRMREIIERVDQTSSGDLEMIRLQYATAADVVRTLTQLSAGQQAANAAAGIAPRITADARSNSVLIVAEPSERVRLATWVTALDTPLEQGGGEPKVIYLKHGDAEELAPLLKEFATGIAQKEAVAAAGGVPGAAGAGAATASVSSSGLDRSTTIIAEPSTNSLIVTAPPKMMSELVGILNQLDIPRLQVLLETIIAEVGTDKAADIGVNLVAFSQRDGKIIPGGAFLAPIGGVSASDIAGLVIDPEAYITGGGSLPNGATFGVGRINDTGFNIGAMVRALRTDGETNVIAEPQIVALDNEEVVLQDGQQVPLLSGFTSSLGQGAGGNNGGLNLNPVQNINREDIGTKLTMTPQINDGGSMTLDIQLESSELTNTTGDAGSRITTNRQIDTKVRVENGQTIVLGGMVRNYENRNETRVPFLGRIPLLGELFKVRSGQRQQKMLMVFIRPTILYDSTQASAATNLKYNRLREEGIRQGSKRELLPLLPGVPAPRLPELDQPVAPIQAPQGANGATTAPVQ